MPDIPLNLTGGTYKHRSLPLSAQVCRNFWPQLQQDQRAKSFYTLNAFPGLKLFSTEVGGDRGMFPHLGVLYKVTGTTLYSVAEDGAHASLGIIPGSGRCIFDGIGTNVVLATDGRVFQYNGSAVIEVTDPDLESPNSVTHINNQVIYDGDGGRFVSSLVGDATDIPALNYATAEISADDLIRTYAFKQQVYMMGDKTIEVWWNSGVGTPPFARLEGAEIPIGLGALYSASNNDSWIYLLADDNNVYRLDGSTQQNVTPHTLSREFESYTTTEDAIGFCFSYQGQQFYSLNFPTARASWIYPEGGEWFELASGVSQGRYIGNSYAYIYRKHLISDYRNGNIYELDEDTFTENGAVIQRTRDTAPMHGGLIGAAGRELTMNRLEILMETGTGLLEGQGFNPVVMLSFSDDGGKTFSTEQWGSVGISGQFMTKVAWDALGSFEARIIRIRTSDPVYYSIHSAVADIEVGI